MQFSNILLRSVALRNFIILIALWEVIGRMDWVARGALPGLSEILIRFWIDRGDYPGHIWATAQSAGLGFLIGNVLAVAAGIAFVLSPTLMRLARGVNIAIFALPPIAIAPAAGGGGGGPELELAGVSTTVPPRFCDKF